MISFTFSVAVFAFILQWYSYLWQAHTAEYHITFIVSCVVNVVMYIVNKSVPIVGLFISVILISFGTVSIIYQILIWLGILFPHFNIK